MNTNNQEQDTYIPYGPEWEKELMKLPKKFLIDMFRKECLKRKELESIPSSPSMEQGEQEKKRCPYELFVEEYYGLSEDADLNNKFNATYADIVNIVCMYHERLQDKGIIHSTPAHIGEKEIENWEDWFFWYVNKVIPENNLKDAALLITAAVHVKLSRYQSALSTDEGYWNKRCEAAENVAEALTEVINCKDENVKKYYKKYDAAVDKYNAIKEKI